MLNGICASRKPRNVRAHEGPSFVIPADASSHVTLEALGSILRSRASPGIRELRFRQNNSPPAFQSG